MALGRVNKFLTSLDKDFCELLSSFFAIFHMRVATAVHVRVEYMNFYFVFLFFFCCDGGGIHAYAFLCFATHQWALLCGGDDGDDNDDIR